MNKCKDKVIKHKKRKVKNSSLNLRIYEADKKKIESKAKEEGMSISQFIEKVVLCYVDNDNNYGKQNIFKIIEVVCELQDIANYIKKNYEDDEYIQEGMDDIWGKL